MKNFTLRTLVCLTLFFPTLTIAQDRDNPNYHHNHHDIKSIKVIHWKFYGGLGGSLYGGEITGRQLIGSNNVFMASKFRPSVSVGIAYKITDRFFLKAELGYNFLKGVETDETMHKFGRINNFQFKTNTFDFLVLGQFNILPYTYLRGRKINLVPYVVAGIGAAYSNPEGLYQGNWTSLQDLSGGQIKNKVLAVIPVGVGVIYRLSDVWDLAVDATVRYSLGSLDGDSRSGVLTANFTEDGKAYINQYYKPGMPVVLKDHPAYNDLYAVLQLRVQYTIIPERYKHLFHIKDVNSTEHHRHHIPHVR